MKIIRCRNLLEKGTKPFDAKIETILGEIKNAIDSVKWPIDGDKFSIYPERKGNGVTPIKKSCVNFLSKNGWQLECKMYLGSRDKPGPIDAVKYVDNDLFFAFEWETGNISSTHRALNKMVIGLMENKLIGGVLVLPSRNLYKYLTDRIGNFSEIEPYFKMYESLHIARGCHGSVENGIIRS